MGGASRCVSVAERAEGLQHLHCCSPRCHFRVRGGALRLHRPPQACANVPPARTNAPLHGQQTFRSKPDSRNLFLARRICFLFRLKGFIPQKPPRFRHVAHVIVLGNAQKKCKEKSNQTRELFSPCSSSFIDSLKLHFYFLGLQLHFPSDLKTEYKQMVFIQ